MRSRLPLYVTLAGIAAWLAIAVINWAGAAPLGHDESQYSIAARETLAGLPPRWFYLSRGMNAIAIPGIWLGANEQALRLLPLLLGGLGFAVATWLVGKRTVGAVSAGIAVIVLAASHNVVRYATDLLSDFPSATCLLAALAVMVDEVDRPDGPRWRLVWAAPLLAAAMYVRYGSVIGIAVIVVASLAVGARTLLRRPLPVLATAGLFLVLLVPHFLEAHGKTGSPLGILLASRDVPQQHYFAEGLVTYVTSNPFKYYGWAIPLPLVAGVLALQIRDRRRLLVWLVAIGYLVAVGITTHAQPRYALFSLALLALLGVDQLRSWLALLPPRAGKLVAGAALGVLAVMWLVLARKHLGADEHREKRMRGTLAAAAAIRADDAGAPCMVIGYHFTQLEWYSGCRAPLIMNADFVAAAHRRGERVYVVIDYGPTWTTAPQPVLSELPGTPQVLLHQPQVVDVVRLAPPPPT